MFEKKDAFEKIKEKLGEGTPVSVRSIDETLDTLMPLSTDVDLDTFVETYLPIFKTMEGNLRKDVADGIKKGLRAHESSDGKAKDEADDSASNELIKAMQKQIEDLSSTILGVTARAKAEEIKTSATAKARALHNKGIVDTALDGFDFTQDDAEKAFDEKVSRIARHLGVAPAKADDTPSRDDEVPGVDAFKAELKNRFEQ